MLEVTVSATEYDRPYIEAITNINGSGSTAKDACKAIDKLSVQGSMRATANDLVKQRNIPERPLGDRFPLEKA